MAKGAPRGPKADTVYPKGYKVITGPSLIPPGSTATPNATKQIPMPTIKQD